jgi:predicted XRE-type DNA-binding protein
VIEHVTPAGGNVFADLGFEPGEAANLLIRTDLMMEIEHVIEQRGLRQKDAAKLFGVSQPRISDLTRGKIGEFTIDSLVNMLAHAGVTVEVSIRASAQPSARRAAER